MSALVIGHHFSIPLREIELEYVRSSGPGGQNVNKVNSKCMLRWNALESPSVPESLRARLAEKLALSARGEVVLASDRHRDQGRNREDCLEKLRAILIAALHVPRPRKKTRPSRGSQRRLQEAKGRHSDKKRLRGRIDS